MKVRVREVGNLGFGICISCVPRKGEQKRCGRGILKMKVVIQQGGGMRVEEWFEWRFGGRRFLQVKGEHSPKGRGIGFIRS